MTRRTRWQIVGLTLLGGCALSSSGCLLVAGGAAATGAAGYAYYKGNVTDTYDADFTSVWHASHDALYDLGLPVKGESHENSQGTIDSMTAKGDKIRIHVETQATKVPTDPSKTQVGVRIATFGDEDVSKRILAQIAKRSGSDKTAPAVPASAEAVSSWKKTDGVQQAGAEKKVP